MTKIWTSLHKVVLFEEKKKRHRCHRTGVHVSLFALHQLRKFAFNCLEDENWAACTIVEEVEVWGGGFDCLCILELKINPHLSRKKLNLHKVASEYLRLNILHKCVLRWYVLVIWNLPEVFIFVGFYFIFAKSQVTKISECTHISCLELICSLGGVADETKSVSKQIVEC